MERLFGLNKIVLVVMIVVLTGCTNTVVRQNKDNWYNHKSVTQKVEKLKVGDIILRKKGLGPMSWYGHAAVVVTDDKMIGDYPRYFAGYEETPARHWLSDDRDVMVLRYKGFNKTFRRAFLRNVANSKKGKYGITSNKLNNQTYYCSQYVWYLYNKTAKDLGYKLDLDFDGGSLVMPYDFMGNSQLEVIKF